MPPCWIPFRSKAVSKAWVLRLSVWLINILTTSLYSHRFLERCLSLFRQCILHFGPKGDLRFLPYNSITIYCMLTLYLHWKKFLAVKTSSFIISQVSANRSKRRSPMCHFHFFYANSSSIDIFSIFGRWQKYKKNIYTFPPAHKKYWFAFVLYSAYLVWAFLSGIFKVKKPMRSPVENQLFEPSYKICPPITTS